MNRNRAVLLFGLVAVACATTVGVVLTTRDSGQAQTPDARVLQTVPPELLVQYGVQLLSVDAQAARSLPALSDKEAGDIVASFGRGATAEFLERKLVRFKEEIPGAPETRGVMLAVVLAGEPAFSGGPDGARSSPNRTGTYFVAFIDLEKRKVAFAIAGERFDTPPTKVPSTPE